MDWNEIPVFISSTFNDMHAERDYILKNVFPQLGEWCEKRHVFLQDIDLRWGVTPQDTKTRNTIYKCLTAVDRCRPFFLCFLGQRRGWVPALDEINLLTRKTFPEIEEMARTKSRSATEYEIEHALLMPLAFFSNGSRQRNEPVHNALFLRRKPDYLADLSPAQKKVFLDYEEERCATPEDYAEYLRSCREANETTCRRIAEKNLVVEYSCRWERNTVSPELITDDPRDDRAQGRLTDFTVCAADLPPDLRGELLGILRKEFPAELPGEEIWPLKAYLLAAYVRQLLPYCRTDLRTGNRYERDAEQQRIFMSMCLRDAVPREEELKVLNAYCDGDSRCPQLILAESGMGKTTLSAQFAAQRNDVLVRFLGVSELSGAMLPMWESILNEAGFEAPPDLDTLRARLPDLLAAMRPRVLLFDGVEQIPGGMELPGLFPAPLPEGIKVILSMRSGIQEEQQERFLRFHEEYPKLVLRPFSEAQKKDLIRACLRTSLKEMSPEQTELACGLNETGNPLYLSVLLADIRSFGSYFQLQQEIRRHGSTPLSAFGAMLARMENDSMFDMLSPEKCVPLVFGLLAAARDGLGNDELTDCLAYCFQDADRETCAGSLHICLRQVRAFLRRIEGRTDFRHQAFRTAAQQRYAPREREFREILVRLFRTECDPDGDGSFRVRDQRALREYAWQLSFVSGPEFVRLYGDVCWLNARCEGAFVRDLIREYSQPALRAKSAFRDLLIRYRDALESCPNLLPSLLWAYGSDEERAEAGFDRLSCSWLRLEECPSEEAEAVSPAETAQVRVLGETQWHAAAFCFAGETPAALVFTGQGQITAFDLRSMLPLSNPIHTAKAMPLGLCAAGNMLAAAFENERIELYAFEADGDALRSKPAGSLSYLPPMYSGAAMCFDRKGRLWYQPKEETIACFDPESGGKQEYAFSGAEEISSLAASEKTVFGTACAGRNTLLFCLDASGEIHLMDLGEGDSRVLCADGNGCLVSCAAADGAYPLLYMNEALETICRTETEAPVAAVVPLESSWLLLPAYQKSGKLWFWDGKHCLPAEHQLIYQDQVRLFRLPDGSFAMLSAEALTHFTFTNTEIRRKFRGTAGEALRPEELPDLSSYELRNIKIYTNGDYACAAGVSASMASVRDERCAGAVFLKKTAGIWRILGTETWPRSFELIRTVCIDPECGRFTLLFRSENSVHYVSALQGNAGELCAGAGLLRELLLPQNRQNLGCFAGEALWLSAGEMLHTYDARDLSCRTAIQLPSPVTSVCPDGERVRICAGGQEYIAALQKGGKT